jgi:3-oxoadipate enol-lactonase
MPKITANDRNIHYKILGTGEPLLLIIGLSFSLLDWGTEFPNLLSQHYQVILFDNRDAGKSDRASQPYTLADMADDATGLLEALKISAAHVFGVSMGGMIAQEMAIRYPSKIKKLILGCTMAGGTCSEYGAFDGDLNGNSLELLFTPDFIRANQLQLMTFFKTTAPYHSTGEALARQFGAMNAHDTCDRLDQITTPTLVITGDSDRAIPPKNSNLLSAAITDADFKVIPDAGHGFCFSHPELTAAIVTDFLKR